MMRIILYCCISVILLNSLGCSLQVGSHKSDVTITGSSQNLLDLKQGVLLPATADCTVGDTTAAESGNKTNAAIQQSLHKHGVLIRPGSGVSLDDLLTEARKLGVGYVLRARIAVWDDPPSFLQQRPDRAQINLSTYDATLGTLLRNDIVECYGYPTLINHIGSGAPEDCLDEAMNQWVDKIRQQ